MRTPVSLKLHTDFADFPLRGQGIWRRREPRRPIGDSRSGAINNLFSVSTTLCALRRSSHSRLFGLLSKEKA